MKEFKGTQGEWGATVASRVIYIRNSDNVLIAEIDYEKTMGFEKPTPKACIHNKNLITAAPDLLEALQDLARFCEENEVGADLSLAGIAIKKALG